jgi:large subunit ribosomal protein L19
MKVIEAIEQEQMKKDLAKFNVGDTIKVHTRVKEGDKERTQVFAGIVIARKGRGLNEQFTVRRISHGEGVERVFPMHSPAIEKVTVDQKGMVRRAKLYYLRNKRGAMVVKSAKDAGKKAKAKASA